MPHLTAAEADGNLDLIAFLQESGGMANLRLKVVGVDIEGQADFLDLDDTLVLSGFLLTFRLFKPVLSVIDNLAYRGRCLRCNFYKVQILSERHLQRLCSGHHPKLVAIRTDDTHFSVTNFFVNL